MVSCQFLWVCNDTVNILRKFYLELEGFAQNDVVEGNK